MLRSLVPTLLTACFMIQPGTARGSTFTVSDTYAFSVTSLMPPAIGGDGITIEGEVFHFASSPFVNGSTPASTPFGIGWPAPEIKTVAGWEYRIDDPNSLDPFFTQPDTVYDFSWQWELFADDTDPNFGGVPSTFSINKTGRLSDLFPPAGQWVSVTVEFGGSSIDAFALVGVDAPSRPGFFEIGFVVLAVDSDLTPFFPPGTSDGADAFITAGTGNLLALPHHEIPEPLTLTSMAVGLAGMGVTGRSHRRRPATC